MRASPTSSRARGSSMVRPPTSMAGHGNTEKDTSPVMSGWRPIAACTIASTSCRSFSCVASRDATTPTASAATMGRRRIGTSFFI